MPHERLVTVAAFREAWQAHLARARIEEEEEEGIPCVVADELVVNANWM